MASREGLVVMSVNVIPEGLDELTRVRVRAEVASIVDDLVVALG